MADRGRGRAPYWAAFRLAGWLDEPDTWNALDGRLTLAGGCLDDLDARRAFNALYSCLTEHKTKAERDAFNRELEAPPTPVGTVSATRGGGLTDGMAGLMRLAPGRGDAAWA